MLLLLKLASAFSPRGVSFFYIRVGTKGSSDGFGCWLYDSSGFGHPLGLYRKHRAWRFHGGFLLCLDASTHPRMVGMAHSEIGEGSAMRSFEAKSFPRSEIISSNSWGWPKGWPFGRLKEYPISSAGGAEGWDWFGLWLWLFRSSCNVLLSFCFAGGIGSRISVEMGDWWRTLIPRWSCKYGKFKCRSCYDLSLVLYGFFFFSVGSADDEWVWTLECVTSSIITYSWNC